MNQTTVVNIQHAPPHIASVYVGRPSMFGNPYVLRNESERDSVCAKYAVWLNRKADRDPAFRAGLQVLRGKRLGCYCAPKRCHADEIVKWLEAHPE